MVHQQLVLYYVCDVRADEGFIIAAQEDELKMLVELGWGNH